MVKFDDEPVAVVPFRQHIGHDFDCVVHEGFKESVVAVEAVDFGEEGVVENGRGDERGGVWVTCEGETFKLWVDVFGVSGGGDALTFVMIVEGEIEACDG